MSGDKKYDDPLTFATNLLTEMKNVGITCDVPPNKLRTVKILFEFFCKIITLGLRRIRMYSPFKIS